MKAKGKNKGKGKGEDRRAERIAEFIAPLRVEPGSKVNLARDFDPAHKAGVKNRKQGEELLRGGTLLLADYQRRLAADGSQGVLMCLQALDAGGKDGTIRHVMSGVNPQGVAVAGFKVPSAAELGHDYLWRYAARLPRRGEIGIFNRSHYEEVLVVRVHPELLDRQRLPGKGQGRKAFWRRRFREINDWERYLTENGFHVVKLFLNLSKEEQRIRFLKRIDVPDRNWKFSAADARERTRWDAYQHAFDEMLSATSTPWAPWYVVPADHKWYARICAAAVLAHTLIGIDPRYPEIGAKAMHELELEKRQLEEEAPSGAAADPYALSAARRARRHGGRRRSR
ncbi:polyphosphate kinase 2 family protein [Streptomyces longispororuber]|uniref:polyphosphate kinase 2 family protein n=1 Tax=Streptomyces longispororuber TaxID=68230 RepID=UPI002109EC09|nr:polyphosphate kinase 2 family protein [Streptomyces longispororuber]MCQ4206031.1 polyphosphate kinase 2 family protein [Streptomyces longispororuber]